MCYLLLLTFIICQEKQIQTQKSNYIALNEVGNNIKSKYSCIKVNTHTHTQYSKFKENISIIKKLSKQK